MFPVRMTHKEHGAMHVYDRTDLEKHEKLGWAVEQPKAEAVLGDVAVAAKKRGRPRNVSA